MGALLFEATAIIVLIFTGGLIIYKLISKLWEWVEIRQKQEDIETVKKMHREVEATTGLNKEEFEKQSSDLRAFISERKEEKNGTL